ncbi:tRNA wybutosine-synthesizing protein 3 homolog isoform X2 [Haemaphysalis longicornis]
MDAFAKEKLRRLGGADVSRKGSIDARIVQVVDCLNVFPQYYTTSSCSGRIIVFSGATDAALENVSASLTLKLEPFILHVRCQSVDAAQKLLAASIGAGCRNSGILLSRSGKVHLAVRTTLAMEVPLTDGGTVLVTPVYLEFLRRLANDKMMENWRRLQRFSDALAELHCAGEDESVQRRPRCPKRPVGAGRTKNEVATTDDYESVSSLFDDPT